MIQKLNQKLEKWKFDKKSIRFIFWKYFFLFTIFILALLWLLQIVFLDRFYESMKTSEVTKIGNYLTEEYGKDGFESKILNYSETKGMKIQVIDQGGHLFYPITWIQITFNPKVLSDLEFNSIFGKIISGDTKSEVMTYHFKDLDAPSIVYAGYLGEIGSHDLFLLIQTPLDPVDSTIDVLKTLLIIVSILSFFFAVLLSFFISKRLSKPLVEMSKTAQKLGSGDYDVHFDNYEYTEIDELSHTLNYATKELTNTIEVRKDLIANVSHDLKTPLTVIKSYGEMIRDISGDNEKMRLSHINTIIDEADHLTLLVNDLLDLSKLESNLEEIKFEEIDLEKISENVISRFKVYLSRDDFDFKIQVKGIPKILGDEKRISQVIYNFINNSISYSGDSKEILILIEEVGQYIQFHCIDKGIGIEEKELNSIWDRFYRASGNHTRPVVGTGIGLSIVKNILEIHGFKYGVKSKKGEGSDFYFIAKKI